ncbi:MAG: T9SS type A sorting domain-containing protein, partial [Bacteroidales bacterium]|nr:T9SS type A sorting domain-containing protein [Bacteroidales bacterium]
VNFQYENSIDPLVTITNCGTSCPYGEYKFMVTQNNGYYDDNGDFVVKCTDTDEVSVWIYEPPTDVDAGITQELCDVFTFDLTAVGSDYCSAETNWYSWGLVSQPATCNVAFTNQFGLSTSVTVTGCSGVCEYGEYVFRFTEYNGSSDVYCSDWDEVSVFIFEMPLADAGLDVNECITANDDLCFDMTGSMDYCYSMYGVWTKTCGPGDVIFTDVNDPTSEVCFAEPGRYKFTWTASNAPLGCEDDDEVIFDLLEQPIASADATSIYPECNTLCTFIEADKYVYEGTNLGDCPNYLDFANWTVVAGPGVVTFADDTDPSTEICVDVYGGYTVRWNEINRAVDGLTECVDWVDIYVEFNETPEPIAVGGEICGNCFTLDGTLDGGFVGSTFYWEVLPGGNCPVVIDINELDAEVCIEDIAECYGTYTFVLHQFNGECEGTDTTTVLFKQLPPPVAICYYNNPNECGPEDGGNQIDFNYSGCLQPNEVLEVCADGWSYFNLNPWCNCLPGFDWSNPAFYGWTFEWSWTGPTGTDVWSEPGYYDFETGEWNYPWLDVNWGECCDTARIYLTITTDEDCELTLEYKAYVHHKPCVDIVGPDVAEVDMVTEYCNNCPPNPCLLYTWTAEHCGIITDGQGTECIDVLWTDYNVNGGWGEITLTVFDTCTGCCNYDEMPVKIYPTGTLGNATLSGYVYYHNDGETPLNGVEVQLWNGAIPVMSTTSFNDIEGGNGMGYYEFTGISAVTEFGVTASYGANWYGANATDALAVELKSLDMLPGSFMYDNVVEEAMNVNNSVTPLISAVDALWIKQRAVNMVNYFPAGNWAFDQDMSTVAVAGYDIYALNTGDANRSNIPASMKSMPAIDLVKDGIMNVVTGEVFTLPIRIAKANEFGAIQLDLEYNSSLVEVVEVVAVEGMISNITDGNVYIAFSNLNTMILSDNDVVVTLKVKAISEIAIPESMFSIGINSEFADATAKPIEPVTLKTFGITTGPAALDYFLSANRPNPFSTSTFIEYTMPETGKVKLTVLDMLGQEIAVLVEATQTAGSYTVEYSAAGLATGVYLYKITVDGETRDFISTQRMVVSH